MNDRFSDPIDEDYLPSPSNGDNIIYSSSNTQRINQAGTDHKPKFTVSLDSETLPDEDSAYYTGAYGSILPDSNNIISKDQPDDSEYSFQKDSRKDPTEKKLEKQRLREERRIRKLKHRKSGCVLKLLYLLAVLVVSAILSQVMLSGVSDIFALNREEFEITVSIPKDADTKTVSEILYKAGVIRNTFFFELYSGLTNKSGFFNHGKYIVKTSMDYSALISYLKTNANRIDTVRITFPEGMTTSEIGNRLETNQVCSQDDFLRAVQNAEFTYSFIKDMKNVDKRYYRLEGYLFPDTYDFYLDEDPGRVIMVMLDNFSKRVTDEMQEDAAAQGMTMDEVITLASIIQREAGTVSDMYYVSSVFHNRLDNSTDFPYLESDPTYWYPYKTKVAVIDANPDEFPKDYKLSNETDEESNDDSLFDKFVSRYSTYPDHTGRNRPSVTGLPYGAITNPGLDAIKAAIYPNNTNYYFFVVDINGHTYYATTKSEHDANVAKAKKEEKKETPVPSEDDLSD